jgi:geranylgeranyl diphosphate synthase, type I
MDIFCFFKEQKKKIEEFLSHFIIENYPDKQNTNNNLETNAASILNDPQRLLNFVRGGKMIRGGLAILSYSLFSPAMKKRGAFSSQPSAKASAKAGEIIKMAAVLELLQSGLLVHDDIMDRDEKRRGEDTIFFQYVHCAERMKLKDPYHTGEALGICAGDLFLFLAFLLLNEIQSTRHINTDAAVLCAREMCRVATGQMFDVYHGADSRIPPVQDIIELYINKTGRYTFSLPLKIGALLAGAKESECQALEKTGELLGVIFQIKDDEINLYGSEQKTGKSVGSDIKEGKKTLYMSLLYEKLKKDEQEQLVSLFRNPNLSPGDIHMITMLIEKHGVKTRLETMIEEMSREAAHIIEAIQPPNKDAFALLQELVNYNRERTR